MIRESELIAQFSYLERQVLLTWIEEGVIALHRDEEGYLFDRVDEFGAACGSGLTIGMLDAPSSPASGEPPRRTDRVVESGVHSGRSRRFLRLSLGFWSGKTRARAWLLTSAVLFFLFANLGAALAVNRWNKFFFDALEQKDTRPLSSVLVLFWRWHYFQRHFPSGFCMRACACRCGGVSGWRAH